MAYFSKKHQDVQSTKSTSTNFSKLRILKNAFVLCLVFFLTFLAYDCLNMLQSTLNHENGIGVICQATAYGCYGISSLLLPKYAIKKLGCKRTLVLSLSFYLPYQLSNLYPHWSFMMPTAIFSGFAASLVWVAQSQYLNEIAVLYATETEKCKSEIPHGTKINSRDQCSECQTVECRDHCYSNVNALKCDYGQYSGETIVAKEPIEVLTDICHISVLEEQKGIMDINSIHQEDYPSRKSSVLSTDVNEKSNANDTFDISEDNILSNKSSVFPNKLTKKSNSDIISHKNAQSITAIFFGIHGMAYLSCHMWSNLMAYFILQNDASNSNITLNSSCTCGANFCNEQTECFVHNLQEPSPENRNFLIGLCVSLGFISILILAVFLDPLNDRNQKVNYSLELLMATARQLKKSKFILLTPFSFYIGIIQGFYAGDFNMIRSFVGCAWGTFHVGLVSVCYGAACSLSSPLSGYLVKRVGRIPVISFGALIIVPAQILLLIWQPNAETPVIFFLIAGLWGTSVGVLWSQVKAMCGSLFKKEQEEATFGAYHLWYSLGYSVSFAYSNHLCTYTKIYILIAVLILGIIGYFSIEITLRRKIKKVAE